ncbi:MAG: hypothetical protein SGPRY_013500 [Prymnesium sp.]
MSTQATPLPPTPITPELCCLDDEFIQARREELSSLNARIALLEEDPANHPLPSAQLRAQREARIEQLLDAFIPLPTALPPSPPTSAPTPSASDLSASNPRRGLQLSTGSRSVGGLSTERKSSVTSSQGGGQRSAQLPPRSSRLSSSGKMPPSVAALAASMYESPYTSKSTSRMMATIGKK